MVWNPLCLHEVNDHTSTVVSSHSEGFCVVNSTRRTLTYPLAPLFRAMRPYARHLTLLSLTFSTSAVWPAKWSSCYPPSYLGIVKNALLSKLGASCSNEHSTGKQLLGLWMGRLNQILSGAVMEPLHGAVISPASFSFLSPTWTWHHSNAYSTSVHTSVKTLCSNSSI